MFSRRLFIVVSAIVAALGVVLIGASLLGVGGNAFEDSVHNLAEVVAGLFACVIALLAAQQSRGRRRIAWFCWSVYAVLEAVSDWNALAAHTLAGFPSWTDVAILVQLPFGIVAALTFMRVRAPRLAVAVAYCDGLLMGGAVLVIGLASGYYSFLDGRTSIVVSMISLAQPITNVVVLTLIVAVTARIGRKTRPVALLLGAALVAIGISDSQQAHQIGLHVLEHGSFYATGWIVGLLCLGLAALFPLCFRRQPDVPLADTTRSKAVMWIPILPVALACAIGVGLRAGDAQIARALVWVMLALIGVTLLRMYFALYMNLGLGRALEHQASHDALTGLPNRTLLKRRLERVLADIETSHQHVTLLMLDLDGFKEVNDTFGHSAGDQVLVQVAHRVVNSVRDVDLVARLGGDEFAVVLADSPADQAIALARRVLASLELPIALRVTTASIATSIGIATGGLGDTSDELLRNADLAMYAAKDAGGNGYALYKPSMHRVVAERVRVETALRTAWLTGDLIVHFQPIVDLSDGRMMSVEALARWRHPDGDMIPPSVFIPIAERTGLIIPIGARVLNEACRSLAAWQADYGGTADLAMSVNVSPRQLYSDDLVEIVQEALRTTGINPRCLILEVTETAMTDDTDSAIRILSRLKAIGVRMAIDDFGVGASSLARLRRLPVDIVKIDKSLVDHVPDGHVATSVLDAVIGVVNALQLRTVIEGVERADQAEHLRTAGYDLAQGYHFAMPMAGNAIERALALAQPSGVVVFPLYAGADPIAPRSATRRVVVVDDDEGVGATACRILERAGMRAVLAVTIREAMAELSKRTEAMVIDIGMPDGDGWSLISHIRGSADNWQMPVVVMTGLLDSAEVLNRAYDLRCEYLGKPFAPEALVAKLESARRIVSNEFAEASEYSPSEAADPVVVAG
ncbi:MAG TPA: EAL domain-containing protein [Candidatus Dormibacteraeota bacterium]